MKRERFNGNSYQRRKLRRKLNRLAVPRILNGEGVAQVGYDLNISTQSIYQHLRNEGIVQKAWMYRKPTERKAA